MKKLKKVELIEINGGYSEEEAIRAAAANRNGTAEAIGEAFGKALAFFAVLILAKKF